MSNQRKKIGLALGSGGIRGLAHIGVIEKLVEHGIPIDFIAGSSIGAWVGAHYAIFQDIERLKRDTLEAKKEKIMAILEPTLIGGIIRGDKVEKMIDELLCDATFADAKIPLAITSSDLVTGEAHVFKEAKLSQAIRASISIPTVFKPVEIGDKLLVDGGVSDPVPDAVARKMGADIVISVNLDNYVKNERFSGGHISNINIPIQRSLNIMRAHLSKYSIRSSDIVIEPYTPVFGIDSVRDYFDESVTSSLIKNGAEEMEKAIPALKSLL